MATLDAMTIRLHLRAMRVLGVVEDLPERLVVAVVAISSVVRCGVHSGDSGHPFRLKADTRSG